MPKNNLSLMEELMLLSLHDEKGSQMAGQWIGFGLAGAALLELTLMDRLDLEDEKHLVATGKAASTGDDILDTVLDLVRDSAKPRPVKHWVKAIPKKIKGIHNIIVDRLVDKSILKEEEAKILFIFPIKRYPEKNPGPEKEIRTRIHRAIAGSTAVDTRTAGLIALMGACKLTKHVFERGERSHANRRVKEISKSSRYGKVVAQVVKQTEEEISAVLIATT